jgi:hypothetical protein
MKRRAKVALMTGICVAIIAFLFLAPVVPWNISGGASHTASTYYSGYQPLSCGFFRIGWTYMPGPAIAKIFTHKAYYLTCGPPLPAPT